MCVCSTNLGFSGEKNCACVRLVLVLVLYQVRIMYQIPMYLVTAGRNLYVRTLCSARGGTRLTTVTSIVATATVSYEQNPKPRQDTYQVHLCTRGICYSSCGRMLHYVVLRIPYTSRQVRTKKFIRAKRVSNCYILYILYYDTSSCSSIRSPGRRNTAAAVPQTCRQNSRDYHAIHNI